MAILMLDLDLTTIVSAGDKKSLHGDHELSSSAFVRGGIRSDEIYKVEIINPRELTELINKVCEDEFNGIGFLTAGSWHCNDIISLFYLFLPLSKKAKLKLLEASFHSPITDFKYFYPDIDIHTVELTDEIHGMVKEIRNLPKSERFEAIFSCNDFDHIQFVLVDDNEGHIESCYELNNVYSVLATTDMKNEGNKGFYEEAIDTIRVARKKELEMVLERSRVVALHNSAQKLQFDGFYAQPLDNNKSTEPSTLTNPALP